MPGKNKSKVTYRLVDLIEHDIILVDGEMVKIMDTFPFKVAITDNIVEALTWLEDNIKPEDYKKDSWTNRRLFFKNADDAVLFKLIWVNEY